MRQLIITSIILAMITTTSLNGQTQQLDFSKVKTAEHQLEDVMELIDTTVVKSKLESVEADYKQNPTELNKVRLGIIYHETALNLGFLAKTKFKGYSKKSYAVLSELYLNPNTTKAFLPFVSSYRASALSLLGGETMKLGLVGDAFNLFQESIEKYGSISYAPEFLRGSVSENLPWFFFSKKKFAKIDMQSIIDKQNRNNDFVNNKVMSFTYWAWANQHQAKKHRTKAIKYLDEAIALDPNYWAGRKKAEELKRKLTK
jgi:tetratricopeptide (TPR) repeat protein